MPPAEVRRGRLVFVGGLCRVRVAAGEPDADLCRVRPARPSARVRTRGDLVVVRFPHSWSAQRWPAPPEKPAEVTLGAGVRWQIEFRGGASEVTADLRGLALVGLEFTAGVGRVAVILPAPGGTVRVRILGGASNVIIQRPPGTAVHLRVLGGATGVALDDQRVGVAGGALTLHAAGEGRAAGRYEVTVSGGANMLAVSQGSPPLGVSDGCPPRAGAVPPRSPPCG